MSEDVMQKFGTGLDSYLSKDQVKALAPVAFATAPTSTKVSDKYLHVNTETIIDDLEKLGWKCHCPTIFSPFDLASLFNLIISTGDISEK